MIIQVKDRSVLREFGPSWHPKLEEVFDWVLGDLREILLTSGYRGDQPEIPGESGIHRVLPLRAFDLSSNIYNNPSGIEKRINDTWVYDPQRPEMKVCILHDAGRGMHFHIQVHNRTERRKP